MIIAATQSNSNLIYGGGFIVVGILHFVFRGFYARRGKAIHDARQATAPAATQRFYRSRSEGWYRYSQLLAQRPIHSVRCGGDRGQRLETADMLRSWI